MRKWDSEIFDNNHLRLMKCHVGLAIFYLCLSMAVIATFDNTERAASLFTAAALFSIPGFLHLLLSYGSFRRIELSRKTSEVVFALMLLAFPIGTFLAIFLFLPATEWKAREDSKP